MPNNALITSYKVLLKESDDIFRENTELCDGSSNSDPDTFGTTTCLISMFDYREEPYSLQ